MQARCRHDDRQLRDARIGERVSNHDDLVGFDREPADGLIARELGDAPAGGGLEPLLVFVEQRDRRDRRMQCTAGNARDPFEALLERRVEQVEPRDVGDLERRRARDGLAEKRVAHDSSGLWRLGVAYCTRVRGRTL